MPSVRLSKLVLVDSDALIGLVHDTDELHEGCLKIANYFVENGFETVVPFSIVLEAATALAKDKTIKRPDLAKRLLSEYSNSSQPYIDEEVASIVAESYDSNTSKKNSPFDYYVLSVAKRNNINLVFSFDSFYEKNGLVLAKDLL